MERDAYLRQLVSIYAHPLSKPREDFAVLAQIEQANEKAKVEARIQHDRHASVKSILLPYCTLDRTEQSFEEILATLESKADDNGNCAAAAVQALAALAADDGQLTPSGLAIRLAKMVGEKTLQTENQLYSRFLGLPDISQRQAILNRMLDCLIQENLIPRYYDYDYLDDIVPIVESRYVEGGTTVIDQSRPVLRALCVLSANDPFLDTSMLSARLKEVLGPNHKFVPYRGAAHPNVGQVIPDLVEEFVAMRAEEDVERFLEINREYSRRQHTEQGDWSNRDLSLLREYEKDHHLLLRRLIGLLSDGKITSMDEALILGPRHIDELYFFEKFLDLPNTLGLDLFESYGGRIVSGDMHDMPFESDRFRIIYSCNTLSYSYNTRKVIDEMARVLKRPGYIFLIDSGERVPGPDPLGRSDVGDVDAVLRCFYKYRFRIVAKDAGRSLDPVRMKQQPCLALELY